MGREIRRVPKGWEHPKNENGNSKPLYDQTYKDAAEEWTKECKLWFEGKHPDQKDKPSSYYFWEWHGNPPDEEYYRPEFETEPSCFQVYETVSEGTPTSPVFETEDEMLKWLMEQGYSEEASKKFIKGGWAPSMMIRPGQDIKMNIHALEDKGGKNA